MNLVPLNPLRIFTICFNVFSSLLAIYNIYRLARFLKSHSQRHHAYRLAIFIVALVFLLAIQAETLVAYRKLIARVVEDDTLVITSTLGGLRDLLYGAGLVLYGFCLLERFERFEFKSVIARIVRIWLVLIYIVYIPSELVWRAGRVVHYSKNGRYAHFEQDELLSAISSIIIFLLTIHIVAIEFTVNIRLIASSLRVPMEGNEDQVINNKKWLKRKMVALFSLVLLCDIVGSLVLIIPTVLRFYDLESYANIALSWSILHLVVSFKLLDYFAESLKTVKKPSKVQSSSFSSPLHGRFYRFFLAVFPSKFAAHSNFDEKDSHSHSIPLSNTAPLADTRGRTFLSTREM